MTFRSEKYLIFFCFSKWDLSEAESCLVPYLDRRIFKAVEIFHNSWFLEYKTTKSLPGVQDCCISRIEHKENHAVVLV